MEGRTNTGRKAEAETAQQELGVCLTCVNQDVEAIQLEAVGIVRNTILHTIECFQTHQDDLMPQRLPVHLHLPHTSLQVF